MKHQQVIPDYQVMLNSSITCIMLAIGGWVLIRLIQAIFLMPGYMARQQEQLYEKMIKRADEICARGIASNNGADYDDDLPSTSTASSSVNGKEIAAAAQEENEADGAKALEPVPILDNAAPLEVKKVN